MPNNHRTSKSNDADQLNSNTTQEVDYPLHSLAPQSDFTHPINILIFQKYFIYIRLIYYIILPTLSRIMKTLISCFSNYYYRILYTLPWTVIIGLILLSHPSTGSHLILLLGLFYFILIAAFFLFVSAIKYPQKINSNTAQKIFLLGSAIFAAPIPGIISGSVEQLQVQASESINAMSTAYSASLLTIVCIFGILSTFFKYNKIFKDNNFYNFLNSVIKDSVSTIGRITFLSLVLSLAYLPLAQFIQPYVNGIVPYGFDYGKTTLAIALIMLPLVSLFILYPFILRNIFSNNKYVLLAAHASPYIIFMLCYLLPQFIPNRMFGSNIDIDKAKSELTLFNPAYCTFLYIALGIMLYC